METDFQRLGRYRVGRLSRKAPIKVWSDGRTQGPGDWVVWWEWNRVDSDGGN